VILTFGESLMRLSPPNRERFFQTPEFALSFGGAEANVAVGLSSFGMSARYVTVLPENNIIADAAVAELRRFAVDVSHIVRANGRFGVYYVETGAEHRPTRVMYDREHSALALAKPGAIDWEKAFKGATWFHITGITPAISASAADLSLESMQKARAMGLSVSFDLNYRQRLWNWGKSAVEVMSAMMQMADILIANEEHLHMVLSSTASIPVRELTDKALSVCPNLKAVALTLRDSPTASQHGWAACLNDRHDYWTSRRYEIPHAVDRIGAGDAFAAGLIYGWINLSTRQDALEFAAAAGCLKHSIPGDFCRASAEEVIAVCRNESAGRIHR
jgi:2-dehydro-3-deoxygluconokinase